MSQASSSGVRAIGDVYLRTHHHYKNSATCQQGAEATGSKATTANESVDVGVLFSLPVPVRAFAYLRISVRERIDEWVTDPRAQPLNTDIIQS